MSRRICAWMVTSSAVVGSSASSRIGIARQRDGDHHALAHAAAELMRVVVNALFGFRNADELQQLDRTLDGIGVIQTEVQLETLRHQSLDAQDGVQARDRVLEDHRHVVAADLAHLFLGQGEQVAALEVDGARDGGVVEHAREAEDRRGGHALAAAGLADEADELARCDGEAHIVDGVDDALARGEVHAEVLDAEKLVCTGPHGSGASYLRRETIARRC